MLLLWHLACQCHCVHVLVSSGSGLYFAFISTAGSVHTPNHMQAKVGYTPTNGAMICLEQLQNLPITWCKASITSQPVAWQTAHGHSTLQQPTTARHMYRQHSTAEQYKMQQTQEVGWHRKEIMCFAWPGDARQRVLNHTTLPDVVKQRQST